MKTWITYLVAILLGFATFLLFKDYAVNLALLSAISDFFINLLVFLYIPMIIVTFSSGVASLKKDEAGGRSAAAIILWSIFSTFIISLAAIGIYYIYPLAMPITSSTGSNASVIPSFISFSKSNSLSNLYPINPFFNIAMVQTFILPAILIAWIYGIALKPSSDVIRPAYTVVNSLAEVMYRVAKVSVIFSSVSAYFFSISFFMTLYQEKTVLAVPELLIPILGGAAILILIVLPFIFALFTRFTSSPYRVLFRSFAPLLTGLLTGNILASGFLATGVTRTNLGVQKRCSSTSIPFFSIIARGGTAFIATLSILMLLKTAEAEITPLIALYIALAAAFASFASSIAIGHELIVVVYLTLKLLHIDLQGYEMTLVAILPLLGGIGVMVDAYIASLGAVVDASFVGTDIAVPYKDTI